MPLEEFSDGVGATLILTSWLVGAGDDCGCAGGNLKGRPTATRRSLLVTSSLCDLLLTSTNFLELASAHRRAISAAVRRSHHYQRYCCHGQPDCLEFLGCLLPPASSPTSFQPPSTASMFFVERTGIVSDVLSPVPPTFGRLYGLSVVVTNSPTRVHAAAFNVYFLTRLDIS